MVKIFQVDAFTDKLFGGNPAAVVPLSHWPDDHILQSVAMENNLAETAFTVPIEGEPDRFELRWFTPSSEVALCGHATLATAHVYYTHLGYSGSAIQFVTRESGTLTVEKNSDDQLSMSFPSIAVSQNSDLELINSALGAKPTQLYSGHYTAYEYDYLAVFDNQNQVAELNPVLSQFQSLKSRGVIVTARGQHCDFVSRYFAPNFGIEEDPVTGSAHCLLAPYWAEVLNSNRLVANQISDRGGVLICEVDGEKTVLTGACVDYMHGQIDINLT